jgi:hypothetical protein
MQQLTSCKLHRVLPNCRSAKLCGLPADGSRLDDSDTPADGINAAGKPLSGSWEFYTHCLGAR